MSASVEHCALCNEPAPSGGWPHCSNCHLVSYCSKEHQKLDWPRHRGACIAYEVKLSPESGPSVVAARNIKKDEVIVEEVPLVIGPCHLDADPPSCLGCFRNETKEKCPSCEWPLCDTQCLVTNHKLECEILSRIKASAIYSLITILPLRCLIIQHTDPEKWEILEDMAHQAIPLTPPPNITPESRESAICFLESILKPVSIVCPEMLPNCTPGNMKKVYSLLDAFGLTVRLPITGKLAAVCAVTSYMKHSCLPNTRRRLDIRPPGLKRPFEYRVIVRATTDIKKGEHLTTMLVDSMGSTLYRQILLLKRRNSYCFCERCRHPTELETHSGTLRCLEDDSWILPIDTSHIFTTDWKCIGKCQTVYSNSCIFHTMHDMEGDMNILDVSDAKKDPQGYEQLLSTISCSAHPNHYLCLLVKRRLIRLYKTSKHEGIDSHLLRKVELCEEVYKAMQHPCFETADLLEETILELRAGTSELAKHLLASRVLDPAQSQEVKDRLKELNDGVKKVRDDRYDKKAWYRPSRMMTDMESMFHLNVFSRPAFQFCNP